MKIEHLAFWVADLEKMKAFYLTYFDMECSILYHNPVKKFSSYFLSFNNSPTRIEIMHRPDVSTGLGKKGMTTGITHFAIAVGNKEKVDLMTEQLRAGGCIVESEPRTTGDGYYESVVLDPEGNPIEITE